MFDSEIAINEFLLAQFAKIVEDVPEESLFVPALGHGHPPFGFLVILRLPVSQGSGCSVDRSLTPNGFACLEPVRRTRLLWMRASAGQR